MEDTVSLRFDIKKTGQQKVLRFAPETTWKDVFTELCEKTLNSTVQEMKEYALFLPPHKESGRKGKYLEYEKTIRSYAGTINKDTTIEFKSKKRALKIRLVDDTTKTVYIDDSQVVRQISDVIGEKIGLKSSEEFSLRKKSPDQFSKAPLWLNETQTLLEQDVEEDEELEYAKKFYYSDDYIDKDDPFTLHLLYVEANRAIISGKYPISRENAGEFAGLQMQIVYGDHDPAKHKPGFFDVEKFLPKSYRKDKSIQKEVFADHKKIVGMTEMNAKYRYVQLVRGLKTYGITFFECKQRLKNKKKLQPVLIGVTREKIIKVDPETQKIDKEWNWNQMRRWSAVKNTFTLDFGDYDSDYLLVITEESEAMSQLIGGYIDIILKSRIDPQRVVEDEDSTIGEEEDMDPSFALAHAGMTTAYSTPYGHGANVDRDMQGSQFAWDAPGNFAFNSQAFPRSSKVNVTDLPSAMRAATALSDDLAHKPVTWGQPPGNAWTEDDWNKQMIAHKANLAKGFQDLLGEAKLGPGSLNRNTINNLSRELAMEMRSVASCARNLAAMNDENAPLLDGAKAVADSVADLMKLLSGSLEEPTGVGFEAALEAARKQILNAEYLLENAKLVHHVDKPSELLLLNTIKNVDIEFDKALKTVAKAIQNLPPQAEISQMLEEVGKVQKIAVSNLESLAPYAADPQVRTQINASHSTLDNLQKELLKRTIREAPGASPQISAAAADLAKALSMLLTASDSAEKSLIPPGVNIHSPALDLMENVNTLYEEIESQETKEAIAQIKAIAGNHQDIKIAAEQLSTILDEPEKKKIHAEAEDIKNKIAQLMEDAREFNRNPDILETQEKVKASGEELQEAAQMLLDDFGKLTALAALRHEAKGSVAGILKLANEAIQVAIKVPDNDIRALLLDAARRVSDALPGILQAIQGAVNDPNSYASQSDLLEALRKELPHFSDLTSTGKKAARLIKDKPTAQELTYAANEASKGLRLLMKTVNEVSDIGGETEFEKALQDFDVVRAELETADFYAANGLLHPIAGQDPEAALMMLQTATDSLAKSIDNLNGAAKKSAMNPDYIKSLARELGQIASAIKPVSANLTSDPNEQRNIIGKAKNLVGATEQAISLARSLNNDPKNAEKQRNVDKHRQVFNAEIGNLKELTRQLEGQNIVRALEDFKKALGKLKADAPPGTDYNMATDALRGSTKALAGAVSQLLATAQTKPELLAPLIQLAASSSTNFLDIASVAAGASNDKKLTESLLAAARNLAEAMSKMLPSAQHILTAEKQSNQQFNKLAQEGEVVQDAVDKLLNTLGSSGEADKALTQIQAILGNLDDKSDVIPGSRQDILNEFLGNGKDLSRVQSSLVAAAKSGDEKYSVFVRETANTFGKMAMAAKSATISDNTSDYLTIDAARICKGVDFMIAQQDPKRTNQIAKQITRAAGNLIAGAKARAHDEDDPNKKKALVKEAQKLVATATDLAQAARAVANRKDKKSIEALNSIAKQMKDNTKNLEATMKTGKDPKDPNTIDTSTSKKLLAGTKTLGTQAVDLIKLATALKGNPQSKKAQTDMAQKSDAFNKALDDVLKVCGTLNPVVQECERAIDEIMTASSNLEQAAIASVSGERYPFPTSDKPIKELQNETLQAAKQIAFDMKDLMVAANKTHTELLPAMKKFEDTVPRFANDILLLAANINDSAARAQLLTMSKLLMDNLRDLLNSVKGASMNDPEARANMTKYSEAAAKALGLLIVQVQSGSQLSQGLEKSAEEIDASLETLSTPATAAKTYPEARENLVLNTRELATYLTDLVTSDKRNPGNVGLKASRIAELWPKVVLTARVCASTTKDASAKAELNDKTKKLGVAVKKIIIIAKELTQQIDDETLKKLLEQYNTTNDQISALLDAAKKGAVCEPLIDKSISGIQTAVIKLQMSDIFARAGQLTSDDKNKVPVTTLQGQLSAAAKDISKQAGIVRKKAAKHSEKELSVAVEGVTAQVQSVINLSVQTASLIPDSVAQRDILQSTKELSLDVKDLFELVKQTQSGQVDVGSEETTKALNRAHRKVGDKAGKLVAVVQTSSAEASRGERELERIRQQLLSLAEDIPSEEQSEPEDVIKACRELLTNSSKFVFSTEIEDVISSANGIKIAAEKVLTSAKGVTERTTDEQNAKKVLDKAVRVIHALCSLIDIGKRDREDEETRALLDDESPKVAEEVSTFVETLKLLPGCASLSLEEPGSDLDREAEKELLRVEASIAEAENTLANLAPENVKSDREKINNAIISAATAIAKATGSLVHVAATAQAERIKFKDEHKGKFKAAQDPMWSQGLINAAGGVDDSVENLVTATISTSEGRSDENVIVAAANGVATATSVLVSASKSKANPNSESQRKLKVASDSVSAATAQLVSAANAIARYREEEEAAKAQESTAALKMQELEMQMAILKLEKNLERERRKLLAMKRAKQNQ